MERNARSSLASGKLVAAALVLGAAGGAFAVAAPAAPKPVPAVAAAAPLPLPALDRLIARLASEARTR